MICVIRLGVILFGSRGLNVLLSNLKIREMQKKHTLRELIFAGTNFRGRKKYRKNRISRELIFAVCSVLDFSRELIFAVGPNMIFFQTQIGTVFFQNL